MINNNKFLLITFALVGLSIFCNSSSMDRMDPKVQRALDRLANDQSWKDIASDSADKFSGAIRNAKIEIDLKGAAEAARALPNKIEHVFPTESHAKAIPDKVKVNLGVTKDDCINGLGFAAGIVGLKLFYDGIVSASEISQSKSDNSPNNAGKSKFKHFIQKYKPSIIRIVSGLICLTGSIFTLWKK